MTPSPFGVMLTIPTAALSAPTVPTVMLLSLPEASVTLKPLPVMVPVSMDELEVILRLPPLMTLPKSTEPASMVSAPVEVIAALPVMLPKYQFPAADTAADDESARMPTSGAIGTDIAKRNGATTRCEGDVGGSKEGAEGNVIVGCGD